MRVLFYHTAQQWSGSARAFAVAARGLQERGDSVSVVCRADTQVEQAFARDGLEVVPLPISGAVSRDAWRIRAVLKDKLTEVVFVHTEHEQLVASSAMRLAERGTVIRRIPAGSGVTMTRGTKLAGRIATARLLFSTETDRTRSGVGDGAFLAPLGLDVHKGEDVRAA